MPFEPGNQLAKGNKNPRAFADMLRISVQEAYGDKTKLRAIADSLVTKAMEGDVSAIKEVGDRLDGKVPQGVAMPDGASGKMTFEWLMPSE